MLATKLVGDGFPRTRPLKAFSSRSVAEFKKLGDDVEAIAAIKLVASVRRNAQASAASKRAGQQLEAAAKAVLAASGRVTPAATESAARRHQRDALIAEWLKAYSLLRLACELVEASGGEPLSSTLLPAEPHRAPKKQAAVPAPAPA